MRAALLLIAFAAAGCDSTQAATSQVEITDQATLAVGETAVVDGISVSFVAVEVDSRCPENAVCVWEGEAFVTLDLDGTRGTRGSVRASARVADPEFYPEAGVRVEDRIVFATALTPFDPDDDVPVVTVATAVAE